MEITALLRSKNVPYQTSGKNTSKGWVSLQCFFCDDHSNHLGINLKSGGWKCLKCGKKGKFYSLVNYLERDKKKAYQISRKFKPQPYEEVKPEGLKLPSGIINHPMKIHVSYLKERGFNHKILEQQYKIMYTGKMGKYAMRVLIPFFLDGKIVSFTARDVTGKQTLRYKDCKIKESTIPVHDTLYNFDNANEVILLVEGVTDVWRIGGSTVASCTVELTDNQKSLLAKAKSLSIMFDGEERAIKKAKMLAKQMKAVVPCVNVIELDGGDPAKLPLKEVIEVRKLAFGEAAKWNGK